MNKFKDFQLDKDILKALNNLQYHSPSKVQQKVIPKLLDKKNIVVKSKTGSGKTASFGIPLCEAIDINDTNVQALVVVPTRELAIQVSDEISSIGRLKKIRCSAIFGKQPIKEQITTLKQRVHVVVATPGRIIDHIERGTINLENIKYLIIDEADKMFNKSFIEQVDIIFNNSCESKIVGLFSATIDENIKSLCNNYMKEFELIEIENHENLDKKQIEDKIIRTEESNKYQILKNLIYSENPDSLIIFCNTRDKVANLYRKLKEDGFLVAQLHGEMSQDKRIFVVKDFKNNKFNMLVSTDVASRGIHIDDISLIINYDVTRDKENYVHRIGRTGRKDKFGKAITIVNSKDEKYLKEIEGYTGYTIQEIDYIDEEKIKQGKINLEEKKKDILKKRKNKTIEKKIHSEVTRLYLNGGKKKKIRVIDIVGAFSNIEGISNEDIGVINVGDLCSYVDILNDKGDKILRKYKEISIKKKLVKIKRDNQGE
ncbi:DEAD/DEAH box helicase [Romboutsia sp.]|uniref:DEAD/DEAH box helicase n=1 Tax=Romboutsia sp. TaxID=1965302 RepID=UPI003F3C277E